MEGRRDGGRGERGEEMPIKSAVVERQSSKGTGANQSKVSPYPPSITSKGIKTSQQRNHHSKQPARGKFYPCPNAI